MRKKCINFCINLIKENKEYDDIKLEEIAYGLEGIYILIEKSIIIFSIAFLLGLAKELFILLIFYNFIRMTSFGLHATKSYICLFAYVSIFLICSYLCTILFIPTNLKIIIMILNILLIFKNAPADTYKRPIISKKRRTVYKILSVIISLIYFILCIYVSNKFISNVLIFSLTIQNFMISPTVYKIFNLPYDNYKKYLLKEGLN